MYVGTNVVTITPVCIIIYVYIVGGRLQLPVRDTVEIKVNTYMYFATINIIKMTAVLVQHNMWPA